jgi:hypothetical protein
MGLKGVRLGAFFVNSRGSLLGTPRNNRVVFLESRGLISWKLRLHVIRLSHCFARGDDPNSFRRNVLKICRRITHQAAIVRNTFCEYFLAFFQDSEANF